MRHKMFAIFDDKAKAYLPPFVLPNADMACRTFGDCVNSKDHRFGEHPGDYTLFEIGDYDDSCGVVTPRIPHEQNCNGLEVMRPAAERDLFDGNGVGDETTEI